MKILLDSDILVAIAKQDDSNHKKAVRLFKKHNRASLQVSQYCIPEVVTVLSYRVSQKAACDFLSSIKERNIEMVYVNKDLLKLADEIFLAQKSKNISWVDCCNVAIVRSLSLDAIASFDKFYARQGLKLLS